jgi:hypothetical protein
MKSTNPDIVLQLALGNGEIDADGWALIAPFGEHPKTRVYREDGQIKEQQFIQVLDNESADALLAKENSFFRKLRRALVGIPTFKGHGDLNDADPAAVSNEAQKIKIGVVDQVRKGERGIEAHFALDNEGAEAVEAGFKYPSAFWWVLPIANGQSDGKAIRCRPFKLISVALTPYPNISGVESLANAAPEEQSGQEKQSNDKENMLREQIIGCLIAKGVPIQNEMTDGQLLAVLANEFHGNQSTGAEVHGSHNEASRSAHTASADANSKGGHEAAAKAHLKAAAAQDKAGNGETAEMHRKMAQYHASRAGRFGK